MTADELRQASGEMRRLAEAATPGPWESGEHCIWRHYTLGSVVIVSDGQEGDGGVAREEDTEHIAAWHPVVALAVADWLDDIAERHQESESYLIAEQTIGGDDTDDEAAFLRRVELGSESQDVGAWVEKAITDDDGNVIASTEPPEKCCSHRVQDGVWPCPEIIPALAVARAFLGTTP